MVREVAGVLMVDIDPTTTSVQAWDLVKAELVERGMDPDTIVGLRPHLRQAWWGGERGFVQEHHDDAQRVAVLNLPEQDAW